MSDREAHAAVGQVMHEIGTKLGAYESAVLARRLGASWQDRALSEACLVPRGAEPFRDPYIALRVLERLGPRYFLRDVDVSIPRMAGKLRQLRNRWAHMELLNADDARDARDLADRLLHGIGAPPEPPPEAVTPTIERPSWWVEGRPATFATAGEKPWRAAVVSGSPAPAPIGDLTGAALDFVIDGASEGYHAKDLDNLLEPVLSGFVNGAGWFGGRRPNLRWIAATKRHDERTGCRINLLDAPPADWIAADAGAILLDDAYSGALPHSLADLDFAQWVGDRVGRPVTEGRVAVRLGFADTRVNLGDIANGRVKNVIDGLWPLLGGAPNRLEDWRIGALLLEKGVAGMEPSSVAIRVQRIDTARDVEGG